MEYGTIEKFGIRTGIETGSKEAGVLNPEGRAMSAAAGKKDSNGDEDADGWDCEDDDGTRREKGGIFVP